MAKPQVRMARAVLASLDPEQVRDVSIERIERRLDRRDEDDEPEDLPEGDEDAAERVEAFVVRATRQAWEEARGGELPPRYEEERDAVELVDHVAPNFVRSDAGPTPLQQKIARSSYQAARREKADRSRARGRRRNFVLPALSVIPLAIVWGVYRWLFCWGGGDVCSVSGSPITCGICMADAAIYPALLLALVALVSLLLFGMARLADDPSSRKRGVVGRSYQAMWESMEEARFEEQDLRRERAGRREGARPPRLRDPRKIEPALALGAILVIWFLLGGPFSVFWK